MSAPDDAPFPGEAAVTDEYIATCSNARHANEAGWAFVPDAATWAAGDRFLDCWAGADTATV